jgi:hypothetical protein
MRDRLVTQHVDLVTRAQARGPNYVANRHAADAGEDRSR